MKTKVSGPLVENESPTEPFNSLELHPRYSHGYRHTPTPKSQETVRDSYKQIHIKFPSYMDIP